MPSSPLICKRNLSEVVVRSSSVIRVQPHACIPALLSSSRGRPASFLLGAHFFLQHVVKIVQDAYAGANIVVLGICKVTKPVACAQS